MPAWAQARDPDGRSPHAHPPSHPPFLPWLVAGEWVSRNRQAAEKTGRRRNQITHLQLQYPGLIKAELPVVSLLPPSASPSPSPLPAAARDLTDGQKPVASESRTTLLPQILPSVQHRSGLMLPQGRLSITCRESPVVRVNETGLQTLLCTC